MGSKNPKILRTSCTEVSCTHFERFLPGKVQAYYAWPEHERVEHAHEAEEHRTVHVVLVAHPSPEQHDVHGVAEGPQNRPRGQYIMKS